MNSAVKASNAGTPSTVKLRQILLQIIGLYPEVPLNKLRDAPEAELIQIASACEVPPRAVERILSGTAGAGAELLADTSRVSQLTAAYEAWYSDLAKQHVAQAARRSSPPVPVPIQVGRKKVGSAALPPETERPWSDVVTNVRAEFLGFPRVGFGLTWSMPRKVWSSPWCEAYLVGAFDEQDDRRGHVLLPTDAAASSVEARSWWRSKVETAARLCAQARADLRVARVIAHASPVNPAYVLLEWNPPCGSLHDYVSMARPRCLRDEVEVALAWCDLLSELNRGGAVVVDLPPPLIGQRWSMSQLTIYLADPTAVLPCSHILPEFRSGLALPPAPKYRHATSDQVFLVGALLLACIRGEIGCLERGIFARGPSASLAALAGLPKLATRTPSELLPSIRALLESHARPERIDSAALVDALRWSLVEERSERYPTLQKFAAALRRCLA